MGKLILEWGATATPFGRTLINEFETDASSRFADFSSVCDDPSVEVGKLERIGVGTAAGLKTHPCRLRKPPFERQQGGEDQEERPVVPDPVLLEVTYSV